MRILHLVPGSGGTFYCQNCLRDYALIRELKRRGDDAVLLPLYLPPFADDLPIFQDAPVFFGGVNVYLRERFPLYRKAPRWLVRFFDSPWILKMAAKREGSTNAADLGPMTLSMLNGENGNQRKDFERVMEWLADCDRPDVIQISNALLLGFAPEIKRNLNIPIVCALQDEEPWVEEMPEKYSTRCWEAMARNAASVDLFIACSDWYAERMRERLKLPREKIIVAHLGVETRGVEGPCFDPPAIGFLSRLSESLGFDVLSEAFIEIKKDPAMRDLRLRATGGCTPKDHSFLEKIRAKFRENGIEDSFDFILDFSKTSRMEFLASLTVLCTPVPGGEAFGVELIEAMAQGVPVVQPRAGAYPEIVEATGGGIIYDPNEPGALMKTLSELLRDAERVRDLGRRGRESVLKHFTVERMADRMQSIYSSVLEKSRND
jgi:glycosyltransferase involved in cell wall biosynthesis